MSLIKRSKCHHGIVPPSILIFRALYPMKDVPEVQRSNKNRWTERERGGLSNLGVRRLENDKSEILKIMKGLDRVHKGWAAPSE